MKIIPLLLLSFFICLGCVEKSESPEGAPLKSRTPNEDDKVIGFADFKMRVPFSWKEIATTSPTRLVEFSLQENLPYKAVGFYLGPNQDMSQEEMVQKNIERWEKQFSELFSKEDIPVKPKEITCVRFSGTFILKTFPMDEKGIPAPNYGALAAIVNSPQGPYFFKITAPEEVILRELGNFTNFLNTYTNIMVSGKANIKLPKAPVVRKNANKEHMASDKIIFGNFQLKIPSEWISRKPSTQMRLREFYLKQNSSYKVIASFFGNPLKMSAEEAVKQNFDRWRKQFVELKKEEIVSLSVSTPKLIYLEGVYLVKPFPMAQEGTPTPNYGMLGAVIPTPEGPYYFKIEAPASILALEKENFVSFLNSYQERSNSK